MKFASFSPKDLRNTRGIALVSVWAAALAIGVYACGGGSDSPTSPTQPSTPAPSGPTVNAITITISGAGAALSATDLAVGGTVTVTNNSSSTVEMSSDPHPAHTDCPGLNFGTLQPGQSRTSSPLTSARTCGMHDHISPGAQALQRTIAIR